MFNSFLIFYTLRRIAFTHSPCSIQKYKFCWWIYAKCKRIGSSSKPIRSMSSQIETIKFINSARIPFADLKYQWHASINIYNDCIFTYVLNLHYLFRYQLWIRIVHKINRSIFCQLIRPTRENQSRTLPQNHNQKPIPPERWLCWYNRSLEIA